METCYALFILNVLIESFIFSATYQAYFENLQTFSLLWSLLIFLCSKLKMT